MDIQTLTTKVQASVLLSAEERTYWLSALPRMNPEQLSKLESILTEAEGMTWNEEMQQYLSILNKTSTVLAA